MSLNIEVDMAYDDYSASDGQDVEGLRRRIAELEAETAQLRAGLTSRQQIGLITGVLSERFGLTPEQTWSAIVRISQHTNLKVREMARILHAGYFDQLADEDLELAAKLNEHLPGPSRLPLPDKR